MTALIQALTFRKVDELLSLTKQDNGIEVGFHKTSYIGKNVTVAQVAYFNEFGKNAGPERPFMRTAFKKHANHITLIRILGRRIINGTLTLDKALDALGEAASEAVRQSIVDFSTPGNAQSVITRKGEDNPLVDSGLMLDSVTHRKTRNA